MLQAPRGTRDLMDEAYRHHYHVIDVAQKMSHLFGFQPIETPIFEQTAVFQKTLGEASDMVGKEMYTFADRGGESMTLRPEGTAPVVRAILSAGLAQTLPQKRYCVGPMFRYERPQKGRFRQFYQFSVEYLGHAHPHADVECISMAQHVIDALGVQNYTLHLNTLGDQESRQAYREALVSYFTTHQGDLSLDSQTRLRLNPLRILDSKNAGDIEICTHAPRIQNYLSSFAGHFFEGVCAGLNTLKINYHLDPKLVRGIDYYCHTAFEFKTTSLGAQDTFLGGGRYDGLMQQMGGPDVAGIGWGMGIERMALLAQTNPAPQKSSVAIIPVGSDEETIALEIAQRLRKVNVAAEIMSGGNMGKKFKLADRLGCAFALILGSDELSQGHVKLRRLASDVLPDQKEQTIELSQLEEFIVTL